MKTRFFHLLAQARQNIFRSADQLMAAKLEVTGTQVMALFAIKSADGCQLKELSQLLQLKNSAVTGLVSRLQDNDLIVRQPCAADGRASRLHLSERGAAVVAQAQPLMGVINRQLQQGFTDAELAIVARFLNHAMRVNFTEESSQ
ncbi:MAG: MarR family transcriptional regulator [Pseudomonadaceae bacterium]|jgi:DNA-binding MarR family transcriptional regulator|nr:MarR family transcriptional regulator [Pseudomonadaceae bacterium]